MEHRRLSVALKHDQCAPTASRSYSLPRLFLLWYVNQADHVSPADNAPESHTATTGWESKLHALTWTFEDEQPRYRHEKWRDVFDSQLEATPLTITALANPLFSLPLAEDEEKWTVWLEDEDLWKRYRTLSHVAILEGEDLEVRSILLISSYCEVSIVR